MNTSHHFVSTLQEKEVISLNNQANRKQSGFGLVLLAIFFNALVVPFLVILVLQYCYPRLLTEGAFCDIVPICTSVAIIVAGIIVQFRLIRKDVDYGRTIKISFLASFIYVVSWLAYAYALTIYTDAETQRLICATGFFVLVVAMVFFISIYSVVDFDDDYITNYDDDEYFDDDEYLDDEVYDDTEYATGEAPNSTPEPIAFSDPFNLPL